MMIRVILDTFYILPYKHIYLDCCMLKDTLAASHQLLTHSDPKSDGSITVKFVNEYSICDKAVAVRTSSYSSSVPISFSSYSFSSPFLSTSSSNALVYYLNVNIKLKSSESICYVYLNSNNILLIFITIISSSSSSI